jgi:hypothetical protein
MQQVDSGEFAVHDSHDHALRQPAVQCQQQKFCPLSTTLALWTHAEKSADGSAGNDKEPQAERTTWR